MTNEQVFFFFFFYLKVYTVFMNENIVHHRLYLKFQLSILQQSLTLKIFYRRISSESTCCIACHCGFVSLHPVAFILFYQLITLVFPLSAQVVASGVTEQIISLNCYDHQKNSWFNLLRKNNCSMLNTLNISTFVNKGNDF